METRRHGESILTFPIHEPKRSASLFMKFGIEIIIRSGHGLNFSGKYFLVNRVLRIQLALGRIRLIQQSYSIQSYYRFIVMVKSSSPDCGNRSSRCWAVLPLPPDSFTLSILHWPRLQQIQRWLVTRWPLEVLVLHIFYLFFLFEFKDDTISLMGKAVSVLHRRHQLRFCGYSVFLYVVVPLESCHSYHRIPW
jgi:hypothetical protein